MFALPEDLQEQEMGVLEWGYGLMKFNTPDGYAIGHTGDSYGFATAGMHFPEENMTFVLLINTSYLRSTPNNDGRSLIFQQVTEKMFE